jgi:glyceraldehyde-3-phosphate dehydrogenase/erythrose-4-phosphate dehydrogenase
MTIKVGINGYGRIGRNIVRAIHESGRTGEFDVVALNDLGDAATNAHLTRRDTAHGPFPGTVEVDGNDIIVNGDRIRVFAERDPATAQLLLAITVGAAPRNLSASGSSGCRYFSFEISSAVALSRPSR